MSARFSPTVLCDADDCGNFLFNSEMDSVDELRESSHAHGWVTYREADFCPKHAVPLTVHASGEITGYLGPRTDVDPPSAPVEQGAEG